MQLSLVLFLFTLLRIPSLFEPYWYGDEGIYQVIGAGLQAGRTVYLGVWDNKPPLLFLLYALYSGDQFSMRLLSVLFGAASITVFYFISSRNILAALVFSVILGLPIIEGNIANTENFMMLPILLSIYLFLNNRFFASGLMVSMAMLFKIVAIFDVFSMTMVLLFSNRLKSVIPFFLGFAIPIIVVAVHLGSRGLLDPFIGAVFLDNAGYTAWKNYFLIENGLLYLKTLIFVAVLFMLYQARKRLSFKLLFLIIWTWSSLYGALFSGRDYPHYLLLLLPSWTLALFRLPVLAITIALFTGFQFNVYWNISGYYQNFLYYKTGAIDTTKYYQFFDPTTIDTYAIAQYIKTHAAREDNVFIWSNAPQIYTLSDKLPPGRLSVAYHITQNEKNLKETQRDLKRANPRFIIILPVYQPYPYKLDGYMFKEKVRSALIYEHTINPTSS